MTVKKSKTSKLFHGQYPYKVVTFIRGASVFRTIKFRAEQLRAAIVHNCYGNLDINDLQRYLDLLDPFLDQIRTRIEHNTVSLYIETKDQFQQVVKAMKPYVVELVEPDTQSELEFLKNNHQRILCNQYPRGQYPYRIVFSLNIPIQTRENLINWLARYDDNQVYSNHSFTSLNYTWTPCYIYVKDKKMIMMISMLAGEYIKKIEEYVLRSDINNIQQGELLC